MNSSSTASVILVVTRNGHLSEPAMNYALNLADRLQFRVLVAYVNTLPHFWDGGKRSRLFDSAVEESISAFRTLALGKDIGISYVKESGRVSDVIHRLCHIVRKIEFVVIDKGIKKDEASSRSPVPVFEINHGDQSTVRSAQKRGPIMSLARNADEVSQCWKRYAIKTTAYLVLTVSLYLFLFLHTDSVMSLCTKGGIYTVIPVLLACIFTYIQSALIHNFKSALSLKRTGGVPRGREYTDGPVSVTEKSIKKIASGFNNANT